jgi:hypothetical protein
MTNSNPSRKRGAPYGNRNALKHALYSRHYPEATRKKLLNWDVKDYIGEVQLLRASIDQLADILWKDDAQSSDKERVAMLNAISRASATLSLLVHRHYLLNTTDNPVYLAWDDVVRERDFFEDGVPPE